MDHCCGEPAECPGCKEPVICEEAGRPVAFKEHQPANEWVWHVECWNQRVREVGFPHLVKSPSLGWVLEVVSEDAPCAAHGRNVGGPN